METALASEVRYIYSCDDFWSPQKRVEVRVLFLWANCYKTLTSFLLGGRALGVAGGQDGSTVLGSKLALRAQEPRHQEVKQRPQLQHIVLYRRPRQDQAVVRRQLLDSFRRLKKIQHVKFLNWNCMGKFVVHPQFSYMIFLKYLCLKIGITQIKGQYVRSH